MRKNHTPKYKAEAVLEVLREAESLNEITGRMGIHPNMLGRWKNESTRNRPMIFEDHKGEEKRAHEAEIQERDVNIFSDRKLSKWFFVKSYF